MDASDSITIKDTNVKPGCHNCADEYVELGIGREMTVVEGETTEVTRSHEVAIEDDGEELSTRSPLDPYEIR